MTVMPLEWVLGHGTISHHRTIFPNKGQPNRQEFETHWEFETLKVRKISKYSRTLMKPTNSILL